MQQLFPSPGLLIRHLSNWLMGQPPTNPSEPRRQRPKTWERPQYRDPSPRPLPTSRPRRLTDAQDADDQRQSALIARLPVEIRVLIWELVVGREDDSDVLHMEKADGVLRYNHCFQRDLDLPGIQHRCWTQPFRKRMRARGQKGVDEPEDYQRRAILLLLLTCKLM